MARVMMRRTSPPWNRGSFIEECIVVDEEPQRVRDRRSIATLLDWIIGRERHESPEFEENSEVLTKYLSRIA